MKASALSSYGPEFKNLFILWLFTLGLVSGLLPEVTAKPNRAEKAAAKTGPRLKIEMTKKGLRWGSPVYLRIFKESNELELWIRSEQKSGEYLLFRNYKICSWSGTLGPKLKQGDHQSPEGLYRVNKEQMNPYSRYHLSFNLGYPNAYDRAKKRTGNYLMVHGNCVSIGCYAMGDDQIEEIYTLTNAALKHGQKSFAVHCFPFRMIKARMQQENVRNSPWLEFWQDLQKVHQAFERTWIPPQTKVQSARYVLLKSETQKL
ncbi:MAG: murein L,D-transpeptidase family protein [Verrucomicrobiota bacterium]